MRIISSALALLLLASHAAAQQPPAVQPGNCPAGTNTGSVRSGTAFRVYWCQPVGQQLDGAKITGLPGGTMQLDNVRIERGPFTDDFVQWSAAVPAQPRGTYTITVIVQRFTIAGNPTSALLESKPSGPFALGVDDAAAPPEAPTRLRIDAGSAGVTVLAPTTNRRP